MSTTSVISSHPPDLVVRSVRSSPSINYTRNILKGFREDP